MLEVSNLVMVSLLVSQDGEDDICSLPEVCHSLVLGLTAA